MRSSRIPTSSSSEFDCHDESYGDSRIPGPPLFPSPRYTVSLRTVGVDFRDVFPSIMSIIPTFDAHSMLKTTLPFPLYQPFVKIIVVGATGCLKSPICPLFSHLSNAPDEFVETSIQKTPVPNAGSNRTCLSNMSRIYHCFPG